MSLQTAVVAQVRALLEAGDIPGAQSFAESLRARPETETIGRLTCGVVAYHRGFLDLAWHRLDGLPRELWAPHAAREYARCGLTTAPEQTLTELTRLAEENPSYLEPGAVFALVAPVLALGRTDVARRLLATLDHVVATEEGPATRLRERIEALRPWAEADPSASVAARAERPTFAVLDYKRPGAMAGSKNIGDHIQSIAALGHLVRQQDVRIQGEPELVELLTHMQDRTRPELRLHDVESDVDVVTVQRDASDYQQVPDGTWTLCFGWYMHPIFGFRFGFPLNRALRPIFVSFHCNDRALLTEPAVEYLKRYGPVGCRDWTTVHLLLSMGVPAFFSGCLTTTISTVFPDRPGEVAPAGAVAYVDMRTADVPTGAPQYRHALAEVRSRSFAANCLMAIERLETYRRRYERVVTSRLHCYLPLRSIGVPVDFRPDNRSDIRFNGLIDITDSEFDAMRTGLLSKLEKVFAAILGGSAEEEVYALWRDITAEDVEAAREEAGPRPDPAADPALVADRVRKSVATTETRSGAAAGRGDVVHCVVDLPKGHARRLRVLVRSLTRHTSRPLHLWVLADVAGPRLREQMSTTFPEHTFSWVPTAGLDAGLRTATGQRPSRLVRLMMADLLPGVDRVVLLPVEAVATADIGDLVDLDLEGHAFAAPRSVGPDSSGFGVLHRGAARLRDRTDLAADLLRNAYASHAFDFDSFTTEVMVLDLARMRAERVGDVAVGLSLQFSLDERTTLHYLAGPQRAEVPPSWAHVPTRTPYSGPGLTHWVGEPKPWDDLFVPGQDLWRRYADR